MEKRVLISTTTFGEFDNTPFGILTRSGFAYVLNPYKRKLTSAEVVNLAKDATGIIAGTEQLGEDVFSCLPHLKVVSRCGAGMDNVDLVAAKKYGIKIYNTPDAPTLAVAELTVGFILNILRNISQMDKNIHVGKWDKQMGNLLYKKNIGIVGFGRIGQKVCELLSIFGTNLAYYDVVTKKTSLVCAQKDFKELLSWADIVTFHLSFSEIGKPLIGEKELTYMKKGSWVINVARGSVIDEGALYRAMKSGHIAGAALDVFSEEPYAGPLTELPNVLLTPHIGSYAKEARIQMEIQAVENLLFCLNTDRK